MFFFSNRRRHTNCYRDWSSDVCSSDLRREPTVYLLPECEKEEEAREYVEEVCGQIFEEQLGSWYRVPSSWPNRRDLDAFDHWFEWSFHSVVADLSNNPLFQEEI